MDSTDQHTPSYRTYFIECCTYRRLLANDAVLGFSPDGGRGWYFGCFSLDGGRGLYTKLVAGGGECGWNDTCSTDVAPPRDYRKILQLHIKIQQEYA